MDFSSSLNRNKAVSAVLSIKKNNFELGSVFQATLQSYDKEEKMKFFGGDYFRVSLVSDVNSVYANGVPCAVIDNEDGSYTITAPLREKGTFWLDIKLILPLEGLYELFQTTKDLKTWSFAYDGELESGESVHCSVIVPKSKLMSCQTSYRYYIPKTIKKYYLMFMAGRSFFAVVYYLVIKQQKFFAYKGKIVQSPSFV